MQFHLRLLKLSHSLSNYISMKGLERQRLGILKDKTIIMQGYGKSKDTSNWFSGT